VGLEKRKNRWFVKLRVAANVLSTVYPYTLPDILLTYSKRSELEIKAQFLESFNTTNSWKEFDVDKTYQDISLSYREIKNRQRTIIQIFQHLKTEKIIQNKMIIHFKDISRGKYSIEVKDLKINILRKINKISFLEKWK